MNTPKTLTSDQVTMLLDNLIVVQGTLTQIKRGFRNWAMAVTMLETGLRVGELCFLKIDDLMYDDQPVSTLVVRKEIAKNKKERQIPISEKLSLVIKQIHSTLWSTDSSRPFGFAFYSGDNRFRLSTRTVERIILLAGLSAFNIEVTPHMLRHTFASRMMRKTNARVVQALLGHSSLQSTQIYMHPNSEDLRKAINGE